jgi:hypothetical protein
VYEAGSVISEKTFGTSTSIGVTSSDIGFTSADFTYLQYYLDEACTQPFSGNFVKPTDGTQPYLYAKFIEGNYNIVRDKNDVNNMLNSSEEGTYYFFNTDASKVIDMTGVALKLKSGSAAMNVKIIGNGYTIKNLTYTVSNVNTQNGVYSMLGKLSASAEINDLTIENVNITLTTVRTSFSIYLVCSGIESGAKFNNFYINGINLTVGKISSSAKIENIPQTNGEYSKDNCLFGGYSSDVDFLAANGGITVSAVTLNLPTT